MRLSRHSAAHLGLLLLGALPLAAQVGPPSTGGAVAAEHAHRMLGHNKRVLIIGAHPDDEDTDLITYLVRGEGAVTAYLALNRGEGGQNLIGPELGEALGVLRTEELLSARQLDGGQQYFTRAYDFGYSKTLEDTWAQWPRDSVLKDVVRVIREFQPQIIVSIFTGTPSDGHGQHQAAGWAAREAFEVAADSSRYVDPVRPPWRAGKLYLAARFTPAATMDTIRTGGLDAAVGKSYHQIAMESRSRHRSQDMGAVQSPGPAQTRIALVTDRTGAGSALWAGIDTLLPPAGPGELWDAQRRYTSAWLANQHGIVLDAVASSADLLPGGSTVVTLTLWNAGRAEFRARLGLEGVPGLPAMREVVVGPGQLATVVDTVRIPAAASTEPYYLRLPRRGAMYDWGQAPEATQAASPPLLTAVAESEHQLRITREVTYRWRDPAYGERREQLLVVPRVGVRLDRGVIVWPMTAPGPRAVTVTLTHASADTTSGEVRLEVPAGWSPPPAQPFHLTRAGEEASFQFDLMPPADRRSGAYEVHAVAVATDGRRYTESSEIIDYPHIARQGLSHPAVATLRMMDIAVPSLRSVGYVRGAADGVPDVLAALGVPMVEVTPAMIARADLSQFDAIVIGSRAYETVPALAEYNGRLLDYARAGGLLLVQYQQYGFFRGKYAPYPMTVGGQSLGDFLSGQTPKVPSTPSTPRQRDSHDRVTDENAAVKIVDRNSPVVRAPNAIGPADWEGWVQERGLYFARSWAPEYHPVLEMHDPGDPPLQGGLLIAPVGRGTYVYTGLAFFRQLPAGVPGAYRLFLNLLALQPVAAVP